MIKNKIKDLDLSATLKINEISKSIELSGKEVIKFGFGQSPFQVPEDIVEELKKKCSSEKLSSNSRFRKTKRCYIWLRK